MSSRRPGLYSIGGCKKPHFETLLHGDNDRELAFDIGGSLGSHMSITNWSMHGSSIRCRRTAELLIIAPREGAPVTAGPWILCCSCICKSVIDGIIPRLAREWPIGDLNNFFAFLIGNVVIGYNVFSAWPFGRVTGLAYNERCSKGLRLDRVPGLMNERGDMRGLEIVEAETPVSFRIRKPQRDSRGPFGKGREGKGRGGQKGLSVVLP